MSSNFTPSQQEALDNAYEKLGEQFDGVLIVVLANCDPQGNEEAQECVRAYYSGGRTQAIGLAVEAKNAIQTRDTFKTDTDRG